jgi:zinc transporter, ZIP family
MTDSAIKTHGDPVVALVFCVGAGASTVFGGLVVFNRRLVHVANPVSLAIALSVSSGVMVFISLVEMLTKAVMSLSEGFTLQGASSKVARGHAWAIVTACTAAGILLIYAVDRAVIGISQIMATTSEADGASHHHHPHFCAVDDINGNGIAASAHAGTSANNAIVLLESEASDAHAAKLLAENSRQQLVRMGFLSVIALGLHNIPEGIATYAGAIDDSTVGFSLAVGIGLHNIPEGIAVAAPIYFATGSRWKGIMWCAVSAAAEPFGGFLAWVAIGDRMNPITEGILFAVVSGIMICICVKELWPTAYRFAGDKTHYVTWGTFAGMFIMLFSLTLFGYAGL